MCLANFMKNFGYRNRRGNENAYMKLTLVFYLFHIYKVLLMMSEGWKILFAECRRRVPKLETQRHPRFLQKMS